YYQLPEKYPNPKNSKKIINGIKTNKLTIFTINHVNPTFLSFVSAALICQPENTPAANDVAPK
ncbi:hypothetical protein, partial [Staphylococcus coagulans]|uniref:hypothetical protein n=1 Tax=Staphylococcus coagulans TaxID=74706 RepID=UPI001C70E06B